MVCWFIPHEPSSLWMVLNLLCIPLQLIYLMLSINSMAFEPLSFSPPPFASEEQRRLHSLCPVHPLCIYMDCNQGGRLCDQLFVMLIRLRAKYRWIMEAISLVYNSKGFPLPPVVRVHSTRGMVTTWALFKGVTLSDICSLASWSSLHTFVWFYHLDGTTPSMAHSLMGQQYTSTLRFCVLFVSCSVGRVYMSHTNVLYQVVQH